MNVSIAPGLLNGTITAPPSKSAMQRACAVALVQTGITRLKNPGRSADELAVANILKQAGCTLEWTSDLLIIDSPGIAAVTALNEINFGESGLATRMITPLLTLQSQTIQLHGNGSLLQRPMDFFLTVLPKLNVRVSSTNGMLPITIKGPLHPQNITINGSLSSQFLTGLIMAYSAAAANDVTIYVERLSSKPYIDLTLQVMQEMGMSIPVNENYEAFHFNHKLKATENSKPIEFTIEGDWSSGAMLLVAGAVAGDLTIKGLDVFSTQADKAVLQPLMEAGANMSITAEEISVRKSVLMPFQFNATDCPDLFPPLAALAAYANGTSVIAGVPRLAHKESNRALALQEELGKMGIPVKIQDDLMIIEGGKPLKAATVHSHNDHRIAMACAVLALGADGVTNIENAGAIHKSYPAFFEDLKTLGASITFTE